MHPSTLGDGEQSSPFGFVSTMPPEIAGALGAGLSSVAFGSRSVAQFATFALLGGAVGHAVKRAWPQIPPVITLVGSFAAASILPD